MNDYTALRAQRGLTQTEAARLAKVSLATWRRWELDPTSVSSKSRLACLRVLESGATPSLDPSTEAYERAWREHPGLTPRQAVALSLTLSIWADLDLGEWLRDRTEPLHTIEPFSMFDLRVMMRVGESAAFAAAVAERCVTIAEAIESGALPFARAECYMDEVLLAAARREAEQGADSLLEGFDIPHRVGSDDDDDDVIVGDGDWNLLAWSLDDHFSDEWEMPVQDGHPGLPHFLEKHHPFTWFDAKA